MSYLLFMDESGHHGGDGYEVRGGIALPAKRVWQFTRRMRGLEGRCFGDLLSNHGKELKATKLFERKRLRIASLTPNIGEEERQNLCKEYFGQARNGIPPTLRHNIAYAQAGLLFVDELLPLIRSHNGIAFAAIVPSSHVKPNKLVERQFVRRDLKYLMAAYYYMLEEKNDSGVLVLDETDRSDDKRFLQRLERYFSTNSDGQRHAGLILPTPLFTGSDMSYPVQAADVICYLISHGFRIEGMVKSQRTDFPTEWLNAILGLRYSCNRTIKSGEVKTHHSIVYVADPWWGAKKREGKTHLQDDHKGGLRGRASTQNYTEQSQKLTGVTWRKLD